MTLKGSLSVSAPKNSVTLSLFGAIVQVHSLVPSIIESLRFDFDHYEIADSEKKVTLSVTVTDEPLPLVDFQKETSRGSDWVQYRNEQQTLIEYLSGKVQCVFSKGFKGEVIFYGQDPDLTYEKLYLFIMSRIGEWIERHSIARIHGFGLNINCAGVIGLAPSGGGKSTLISALMRKDPSIKIYSDDMPLIDTSLAMIPFVHRLSLLENPTLATPEIPSQFTRIFNRKTRSPKTVISWKLYKQRWGRNPQPINFFISLKFTKEEEPVITPLGRFALLRLLARDMIIGYGLPQVVEFFLVNGWKSIFAKFPQVLRRTFFAIRLAFSRSVHGAVIWQTADQDKNAEMLIAWLTEHHSQPRPTHQ